MNEKAYKTMGIAGAANIAAGIVTLVVGIAVGVIAIVSGVQLRKDRKGLTF
ncbi:MAG: hypothetical protein HFG99_10535 [Dorea sp.]|jgi:hypothetical protein|nr:hypothetical protein [Dorea sp.]